MAGETALEMSRRLWSTRALPRLFVASLEAHVPLRGGVMGCGGEPLGVRVNLWAYSARRCGSRTEVVSSLFPCGVDRPGRNKPGSPCFFVAVAIGSGEEAGETPVGVVTVLETTDSFTMLPSAQR